MKTELVLRAKIVAACGLVTIAAFVTHRVTGPGSGAPTVTRELQPTTCPAQRSTVRHADAAFSWRGKQADSVDPTLAVERLGVTESSRYKGSGRNLFRVVEEGRTKKEASEHQPPLPTNLPRVAPSPLPIPLRFFGFSGMGRVKRVFLSKNQDVFIAAEGDIVDRRYRVVRITGNAVELEDVLKNSRQMIFLTQG